MDGLALLVQVLFRLLTPRRVLSDDQILRLCDQLGYLQRRRGRKKKRVVVERCSMSSWGYLSLHHPSIHPWDLGVRVIRAARIDFKTRVQSWGRSLIFLTRPHSQVGSTPWELRSTHNHTIPSITTTLPRASIHAATKGYLWNYNSVREGQARQGRAGHRRGSLSLCMYRYVGSPVIQCACVCAWPA